MQCKSPHLLTPSPIEENDLRDVEEKEIPLGRIGRRGMFLFCSMRFPLSLRFLHMSKNTLSRIKRIRWERGQGGEGCLLSNKQRCPPRSRIFQSRNRETWEGSPREHPLSEFCFDLFQVRL